MMDQTPVRASCDISDPGYENMRRYKRAGMALRYFVGGREMMLVRTADEERGFIEAFDDGQWAIYKGKVRIVPTRIN